MIEAALILGVCLFAAFLFGPVIVYYINPRLPEGEGRLGVLISALAVGILYTWIQIISYVMEYEPEKQLPAPPYVSASELLRFDRTPNAPYICNPAKKTAPDTGVARVDNALSFISNGKRFATVRGAGKAKHVWWDGAHNLSLYGMDGIIYEIEHIPLKACRVARRGSSHSPFMGAPNELLILGGALK